MRDSLAGLEAVRPLHVGPRLLPREVVGILLVDPLDDRDVPESLGRHVDDSRPGPLEQCVRRDRRAEIDRGDVTGLDAGRVEGVEDRRGGIPRGRRSLAGPDLSGELVEGDEVGEGPSGIDADANFRLPRRSRRRDCERARHSPGRRTQARPRRPRRRRRACREAGRRTRSACSVSPTMRPCASATRRSVRRSPSARRRPESREYKL